MTEATHIPIEQRLPGRAYHPSHEKHTQVGQRTEPYIVGRVEQLLRIDLHEGGGQHGVEFVEETIKRRQVAELESILDPDWFKEKVLNHRFADPFIKSRLRDCLEVIEETADGREWWYENMLGNIEERFIKAAELLYHNPHFDIEQVAMEYKPEVYNAEDTPLTIETARIYNEKDNKAADSDGLDRQLYISQHDAEASLLRDFGYTLPLDVPIIVTPSSMNGRDTSIYPLVPWYGVSICTCGDKLGNTTSAPLCKHEIAALLLASQQEYTNTVHRLHPQCRRLVNWEVYQRYDAERNTMSEVRLD